MPLCASLFTPREAAPHLEVGFVTSRVRNVTLVSTFGDWFVCALGLFPTVDVGSAARSLAEALAAPRPGWGDGQARPDQIR
ncbi:hypothetical protein ACSNOI_04020 [Actinomadura kijaniata]|uniref:hypothetical protein n=1 Tax=Actinomadura kijaniata TaxID=46161 RepID=UPI003F19ED96